MTLKRGEKRAAVAQAQRQVDRVAVQLANAKVALDKITPQHREYKAFIAEHGDVKTELGAKSATLLARLRQFVDSYRDDPPAYIETLGPIPDGGLDFGKGWQSKAVLVELYRVRAHITDNDTTVNEHGKPVASLFPQETNGPERSRPEARKRMNGPSLGL